MPSWLFSLPALADFALLVLRLVIGLMFAMSGFFKLTNPERRQKMRASLQKAGVPIALTPILSSVELVGGVLVVLGLLTTVGALALLAVGLGALLTTGIPKAEGQGVHKLENVLYAPEAILAAGLLVLLAMGAGGWSVDALLR
ncbi:DoxX family membrane protein [Devosia psychrophila]|jgi:putative oxidoreductase|uniref:Putative oxidoreductase n=1 Tax=Devosia psychrophila TaxID=728005 RepID=A0A1I1FNF8_9HYPH|nr:DoxX family membrane protein [Devosia psychrophila]SFC00957.1 putative oxidoreductase [Devosia psychrophila]